MNVKSWTNLSEILCFSILSNRWLAKSTSNFVFDQLPLLILKNIQVGKWGFEEISTPCYDQYPNQNLKENQLSEFFLVLIQTQFIFGTKIKWVSGFLKKFQVSEWGFFFLLLPLFPEIKKFVPILIKTQFKFGRKLKWVSGVSPIFDQNPAQFLKKIQVGNSGLFSFLLLQSCPI